MSFLIGITTKAIITSFTDGAMLAVSVYLATKGIKKRQIK